MNALVWFVVAIVAAAVIAWRAIRTRNRQRRLMLLCMDAGLRFSTFDPFPDTAWQPFALFAPHMRGRFENVIWDPRTEGEVRVFDVRFQAPAGDGSEPVDLIRALTARGRPWEARVPLTCAIVPLPFTVPRIEIAPRDVARAAMGSITGRELDLELESFNRRFDVRCDDRRFAVAFLDQRMMRTLLGLPGKIVVLANEDRMLMVSERLDPAQMLLLLEAARVTGERVPAVVASLYPPRPARAPQEARWLQGHWSPDPSQAVAPPEPPR